LPFYKELENDIKSQGSNLINTYRQHNYIANFEYYYDIENLTPRTYFRLEDVPDNGGPFIVKGATNSRKFLWKELMFAPTKRDAINISIELRKDSMISQQDIIVREFVPLEKIADGFQGLPISNEWRFFIYREEILSYGFYWANTEKELWPEFDPDCLNVVSKAIFQVGDMVEFFVIDVAKTQSGEWIVIEMNDGQMSGLSGNDPDVLYGNLKEALKGF